MLYICLVSKNKYCVIHTLICFFGEGENMIIEYCLIVLAHCGFHFPGAPGALYTVYTVFQKGKLKDRSL